MRKTLALLLLAAAGCTASSSPSTGGKPTAPPPAETKPAAPVGVAPSPTPVPYKVLDPNVIEETDTYVITRLPKSEYIKVGDREIKHPILGMTVQYFKEDDEYYYVIRQKRLADEDALKNQTATAAPSSGTAAPKAASPQAQSAVPLSDFEDLTPARVSGRLRLETVSDSGLATGGMWRASFVMADMNGDGKLDVVAPAPRVGDGTMHIWLGQGGGKFTEWPLKFTENGQPATTMAISYGGVAAGDIDGDGHMDVVTATHGSGLAVAYGDGNGGFRISRQGLPRGDFSAQAVVLVDVDGDGKLDIVASRDREKDKGDKPEPVDKSQVRVYLNRGAKGWEFKQEAIVGGFYSTSLSAWDFDADGRKDILTGSHYVGALTLLWKNEGNGTLSPVMFDAIEIYAYHFATQPGTFGAQKLPAFADAYLMVTNVPQNARATGLTVYSKEASGWKRHRVLREKDGKSLQFALAMGDMDGDGLDDVVFADSNQNRLRVIFQEPNGEWREADEKDEPVLSSPGQCVRLADLNGDGRLDVVLAQTVTSSTPGAKGGWSVFLNQK